MFDGAVDVTTDSTDIDNVKIEYILKDSNNSKIYNTKSLNNLTNGTINNTTTEVLVGLDIENLTDIKDTSNTIVKSIAYHGVASTGIDGLTGFNTSLSAPDYYVIGNPTLIELSQGDYNKYKN